MRGFSSYMLWAAFRKKNFPSLTLLPTLLAPTVATPMALLSTNSGIALPMLLLDLRALSILKPCTQTTCQVTCFLASLALTMPRRMPTMRRPLLARVLTCGSWAALASHSKVYLAR